MKLLALPVRTTDRLVARVLLCTLLGAVGAADASGDDTGHPRIRSTIGICQAAPADLPPCVPQRGGAPLPAAEAVASRTEEREEREEQHMGLADSRTDVALTTLALLLVVGAVTGVSAGQLMQTRGRTILGDAICGVAGTLIGVVVPRALFNVGQFGFVASLLLTIASAIMATVIGHVALLMRR
jgi:uncharacterized membrane protein YeaQ/YmgE (transglycosylase-associated protein family)